MIQSFGRINVQHLLLKYKGQVYLDAVQCSDCGVLVYFVKATSRKPETQPHAKGCPFRQQEEQKARGRRTT